MQAEAYHVIGSRDSTTPLDQAGHRFLFNYEDASYLLIVDYTSSFVMVCKLSSMTG